MSNMKQDTAIGTVLAVVADIGEATRGTSAASICETMDDEEKQKIMEQLQMLGYME